MVGRNRFLSYLVLVIIITAAFVGIIWWTLPLVSDNQSKEVPIIPDDTGQGLRVLDPPVKASENNQEPEPVAAMVSRVGSSVVRITTVQERIYYDIFFGQQQEEVTGEGSGVFFDDKGFILTNNHVVADADQITVLWVDEDGKEQEKLGKVLGRDPLTDLAVVKVDAQNFTVAPLGNSDQVRVGDTAVAIGNPYGFSSSVTVGVVSALNRDLPLREGVELLDLIQTDAAINPGNSGGALFNLDGQVIGINTAMLQGAQGLGFAIPINLAREVGEQIIELGEVKRPWVGIYGATITPELQKEYRLPVSRGVFITEVIANGPAKRAGIREEDIITEFNGLKLDGMKELIKALRNQKIGEKVKVVVVRDGKEREFTLTLREHPGLIEE